MEEKIEEILKEGLKHHEKEEYDKALPHFLEALKIYPNNARINCGIAACYYMLGSLDESLNYCKSTLRIDSECCPAIHKIALIYYDKDLIEKSIKYDKRAIKFSSKHNKRFILFNLGRCYIKKKMFKVALKYLLEVLNEDISHEEFIDFINYIENIDLMDHIEEFMKKKLVSNKKNIEIMSRLGIIYIRQQKLKKSLPLFMKILKLDPNDLIALKNLGVVYKEMGRYEESVNALKRLLSKDSDNEEIIFEIIFTLLSAGLVKDALSYFEVLIGKNKIKNMKLFYVLLFISIYFMESFKPQTYRYMITLFLLLLEKQKISKMIIEKNMKKLSYIKPIFLFLITIEINSFVL